MLKIYTWLVALLLFLPKVNLVEVSGFRAGLRVDDFIIAAGSLWMFLTWQIGVAWRVTALRASLFFIFASLLSHITGQGHILFTLRMIEYFTVGLIAFNFASKVKDREVLSKILFVYLCCNTILCILQISGIAGGISLEGFTADVGGRAFGLCNGPWELGIVLCLIFGYLSHSLWIKRHKLLVLALYIFTLVSLITTSARTPIAIYFIITMLNLTELLRGASRILARFIAPLIGVMLVYIGVWTVNSDNMAIVRLREFLNQDNLTELVTFFTNFSPDPGFFGFALDNTRFSDASMDASMAQRLYIFTYVFSNYYLSGPLVWLIGLGHGFSGSSTDMGVVRLLCETGVFGFLMFHWFMYEASKVSKGIFIMVVAILFNQFTLDVYIGYKTMFVFMFALGFEIYHKIALFNHNRTIKVTLRSAL